MVLPTDQNTQCPYTSETPKPIRPPHTPNHKQMPDQAKPLTTKQEYTHRANGAKFLTSLDL